MSHFEEVRRLLHQWARSTTARDVDRIADLFVRDDPLVTWSDGERCASFVDLRVRLDRDLSRTHIDRVEVHDLVVREAAAGVLVASFVHEIETRDLWGTTAATTRVCSMTLVRTKDGLRVQQAHFSAVR